jgi:hypothetical protein
MASSSDAICLRSPASLASSSVCSIANMAHFHAVYGEHEASIEIDPVVVHGSLPPTPLRLVLEWARLHKRELLENWQLARLGQPLKPIPPLE